MKKEKKIFCQDHFKSFKKFSSKGIPESISPLWICNACRYLSKLFRMSRSFVSSFKIWCNEKGTMSKDNKTNFLLTPTYSSDMMANSQDEKKNFLTEKKRNCRYQMRGKQLKIQSRRNRGGEGGQLPPHPPLLPRFCQVSLFPPGGQILPATLLQNPPKF